MSEQELRNHIYKIADEAKTYCDTRADEHYQQARTWSSINRKLTLPAAVLAGAAGTAIIADSSTEIVVLIAGAVALVVAALTAASHVLGANDLANQHKKGFDGFSALATRFQVFRECTLQLQRSNEELMTELSELLDKRNALAAALPETSMRARNKVYKHRKPPKSS